MDVRPAMNGENFIVICQKTHAVYYGCLGNEILYLVGQARDMEEAATIALKYEQNLFKQGDFLEYGVHFLMDLKGYTVKNDTGSQQ